MQSHSLSFCCIFFRGKWTERNNMAFNAVTILCRLFNVDKNCCRGGYSCCDNSGWFQCSLLWNIWGDFIITWMFEWMSQYFMHANERKIMRSMGKIWLNSLSAMAHGDLDYISIQCFKDTADVPEGRLSVTKRSHSRVYCSFIWWNWKRKRLFEKE